MYDIRFYSGDYLERQQKANADNCNAYIEHHFNSCTDPKVNYAVVITGANASQTSKNWGRWYASAIAAEFGLPVGGREGIQVGGFNGRGDYNLRFTKMPAILLEPLFASNPVHADIIRSDAGQIKLARILAESIRRFFQDGGRIGFSVGHKYKKSSPNDRGADLVGGGTEADYAEMVLHKAKSLLDEIKEPQQERSIRVINGDKVVWAANIDMDAEVRWDPLRGALFIEGRA
ncbi:MAG: N-acetylmuramoyl-L-alanine amidase [Deltaproteobacteria bacterium]|nr:N-acetylmuramoyl-L-alanine amidase [Deltaproteobacteria bacterium]MBZ0219711.1 N-acetylmuramoyl-L-alanine amidase [Deltaproteobacteria bacterium]